MNELWEELCPCCRSIIKPHSEKKVCNICGRIYHSACWSMEGGCIAEECKKSVLNGASPKAAEPSDNNMFESASASLVADFFKNPASTDEPSEEVAVQADGDGEKSEESTELEESTPASADIHVSPELSVEPQVPAYAQDSSASETVFNAQTDVDASTEVAYGVDADAVNASDGDASASAEKNADGGDGILEENEADGNTASEEGDTPKKPRRRVLETSDKIDFTKPELAEYEPFLKKRTKYYMRSFERLESNFFRASFNFSAFLFGPWWLIYRRMYKYGILLAILTIIVNAIDIFLDIIFINKLLVAVVWLIIYALLGIYGNYLYKKELDSCIMPYRIIPQLLKEHFVKKNGGVKPIKLVLLMILYFLVDSLTRYIMHIIR